MKAVVSFAAVALFASVGLGADQPLEWPRFRGPDGSGVADGRKPPVEFGPDRNVKWKVPAPVGLSSPIIAGDFGSGVSPIITLYLPTEQHPYAFAEEE